MKLCKLSFENINSLAGRWSIDFEAPAFEDGLFLIAGDTGSGKTTILDAISLALYGRTVRECVTKERNEVMTYGRGSAWAEVEFVSGQGRFRARWEQSRARGKATGALQVVKVSLVDVNTGKDIGDHRKDVTLASIAEKIGLSFEQFQRTMMLAQGKFDQFLSAKESDRAEILEQATGTEIFAQIGEKIFEAFQKAEAKVATIRTQLGESNPMGEAEREMLENEFRDKKTQKELKNDELTVAKKERDDYEQKKKASDDANAEFARRKQAISECGEEVTKAMQTVTECDAAKKIAENEKNAKEPAIRQALDLKKNLLVEEQKRAAAMEQAQAARDTLKKNVDAESALKQKIATKKALVTMVTNALAGMFEAPDDSEAAKDPLVEKAKEYVTRAAAFAGKEKEIARLKAAAAAASSAFDEEDSRYQAVHPGLQAAFDSAETALKLAEIVDNLEEHRKNLEDGKPCPLCGSLEHPYAFGNKPAKSACQTAYDNAKQAVKDLEAKRNAALTKRQQTEKAFETAKNAVAGEEAACEALKRDLDRAQVSLSAEENSAQTQLRDLDDAIRFAKADLEAKETDERKTRNQCEAIDNKIKALNLGKDPEVLRQDLQDTLDAANAASAQAQTAKATAETNAANAKTEADRAQQAAAAAGDAFKAVQAKIPDVMQHQKSIVRLQEEKGELDDAIAKINVKRGMDKKNRERCGELTQQLTKAEDVKAKWANLNKWLGGSGGEKFKRYAQGITLRQLLKAANPHLSAMTQGRYELLWDPERDDAAKLLPSIVDKDQAGVTRPITNLSGGERFQVSLAMALGLSEMSGNRIKVDSLFLDEGFGTLDGKTLEAALDTLCRIQQDGKLIGVISHVTEVADRITTQIEVQKVGGGLSVLNGPGVTGGEKESR